jgi:hypothetical protein
MFFCNFVDLLSQVTLRIESFYDQLIKMKMKIISLVFIVTISTIFLQWKPWERERLIFVAIEIVPAERQNQFSAAYQRQSLIKL